MATEMSIFLAFIQSQLLSPQSILHKSQSVTLYSRKQLGYKRLYEKNHIVVHEETFRTIHPTQGL